MKGTMAKTRRSAAPGPPASCSAITSSRATNHYHYIGPFGDYLGFMYGQTPDTARDAKDFLLQNMWEEELSDVRHTDLLIRFAEACGGGEYVMDRKNAMPFTKALQG